MAEPPQSYHLTRTICTSNVDGLARAVSVLDRLFSERVTPFLFRGKPHFDKGGGDASIKTLIRLAWPLPLLPLLPLKLHPLSDVESSDTVLLALLFSRFQSAGMAMQN